MYRVALNVNRMILHFLEFEFVRLARHAAAVARPSGFMCHTKVLMHEVDAENHHN